MKIEINKYNMLGTLGVAVLCLGIAAREWSWRSLQSRQEGMCPLSPLFSLRPLLSLSSFSALSSLSSFSPLSSLYSL